MPWAKKNNNRISIALYGRNFRCGVSNWLYKFQYREVSETINFWKVPCNKQHWLSMADAAAAASSAGNQTQAHSPVPTWLDEALPHPPSID